MPFTYGMTIDIRYKEGWANGEGLGFEKGVEQGKKQITLKMDI
ncbi:MAG: hypothetical protein ABIX01_06545 [Chitinophagaceae bacterium]